MLDLYSISTFLVGHDHHKLDLALNQTLVATQFCSRHLLVKVSQDMVQAAAGAQWSSWSHADGMLSRWMAYGFWVWRLHSVGMGYVIQNRNCLTFVRPWRSYTSAKPVQAVGSYVELCRGHRAMEAPRVIWCFWNWLDWHGFYKDIHRTP